MSHELKDTIEKLATRNNRSMNAEIVERLEVSIAEEEAPSAPINVMFDDDWLAGSGLTKAEFGAFVKMAVQSGLQGLNDE